MDQFIVVVVEGVAAEGKILLKVITYATITFHRLQKHINEFVIVRPVEPITVAENCSNVKGKVQLIRKTT